MASPCLRHARAVAQVGPARDGSPRWGGRNVRAESAAARAPPFPHDGPGHGGWDRPNRSSPSPPARRASCPSSPPPQGTASLSHKRRRWARLRPRAPRIVAACDGYGTGWGRRRRRKRTTSNAPSCRPRGVSRPDHTRPARDDRAVGADLLVDQGLILAGHRFVGLEGLLIVEREAVILALLFSLESTSAHP